MKFLSLYLIIIFFSCNPSLQNNTSSTLKTNKGSKKDPMIIIEGIVKSKRYGKDGYVIGVLTKQRETYFALISIPNLGRGARFKDFKVGDRVKLFGEFWYLGKQKRLTVRKILPQ